MNFDFMVLHEMIFTTIFFCVHIASTTKVTKFHSISIKDKIQNIKLFGLK